MLFQTQAQAQAQTLALTIAVDVGKATNIIASGDKIEFCKLINGNRNRSWLRIETWQIKIAK